MDTSDSVETIINRIKTTIASLNSEPQDCSNWQNLTRLIDIINTDTNSLRGQQYFISFDSSSSSSLCSKYESTRRYRNNYKSRGQFGKMF